MAIIIIYITRWSIEIVWSDDWLVIIKCIKQTRCFLLADNDSADHFRLKSWFLEHLVAVFKGRWLSKCFWLMKVPLFVYSTSSTAGANTTFFSFTIHQKYPLIKNFWGVMDGLNFSLVHWAGNETQQNNFYNGWTHEQFPCRESLLCHCLIYRLVRPKYVPYSTILYCFLLFYYCVYIHNTYCT